MGDTGDCAINSIPSPTTLLEPFSWRIWQGDSRKGYRHGQVWFGGIFPDSVKVFVEGIALKRRKLEVDWRVCFTLFSEKVVDGEMFLGKGDEIGVAHIWRRGKYLPVKICRELLDSHFVYSEGFFYSISK